MRENDKHNSCQYFLKCEAPFSRVGDNDITANTAWLLNVFFTADVT